MNARDELERAIEDIFEAIDCLAERLTIEDVESLLRRLQAEHPGADLAPSIGWVALKMRQRREAPPFVPNC